MRLRWAAGALGALCVAATLAALAPSVRAVVNCDTARADLDAGELQMLSLVNSARQQAGVPPLRPSSALNRAAAWMSEDIARTGNFSHTDSLGRNPSQRARDCGYPWGAGENLARVSTSPQVTFEAWMQSPGHRANILAGFYTVIGVGHFQGVWTLNFGTVDDSGVSASPSATPTPTPTPTRTPTPTPTPTPGRTPTAVSVPLHPGFNLVTYGGPPASPPAALASVGSALVGVYRWDAASGTWERYLEDAPTWVNTLALMRPGEAYFVGVAAPAVWTFEIGP